MTLKAELLIDSRCTLGEGPLWHPSRRLLYWFDIPNHVLFAARADGEIVERHAFDQTATAAAIVDERTLLVAASESFLRLDLETGSIAEVAPLEPDPSLRSNDGRVSPAGGFWIGTMRRGSEDRTGALFNWRAGHLQRLLSDVAVPNSTCFSPDGRTAYFTGEKARPGVIRQVSLDENGLPLGEWRDFAWVERPAAPDGAVVDSAGYLWNAEWNGGRVVRYTPNGSIDSIVELPVSRVTCPAFGGDDLRTLFITTAREGLSDAELALQPLAGGIFAVRVDVPGQQETPVRLAE